MQGANRGRRVPRSIWVSLGGCWAATGACQGGDWGHVSGFCIFKYSVQMFSVTNVPFAGLGRVAWLCCTEPARLLVLPPSRAGVMGGPGPAYSVFSPPRSPSRPGEQSRCFLAMLCSDRFVISLVPPCAASS